MSIFDWVKNVNYASYANRYFESKIGVCLQCDLSNIPPLYDIQPFYMEEMSINDYWSITKWLEIINEAYGIKWNKDNYFETIVKNPFFFVTNTFFMIKEREPVGTISIGAHRKNPNIGTLLRIALKKNIQGKSLGKYLILYGAKKLRDNGVFVCDSNVLLIRKESIFSHFTIGFVPKYQMDYWNINTPAQRITRLIINHKLKNKYNEWQQYNNNT